MNALAAALVLAALCTGTALAAPSLKGDISVNADIVTVGDMFDNPGDLSETAIFRAPAPGTTGIVPLADVAAAARLAGLAGFDNVGYTRIRVARRASIVDAAALGALVAAELARRGVVSGPVTADARFDRAELRFSATEVADPAVLTDLRYGADTGAFTARFSIAGIDRPVDLTGSVALLTRAPRLIAGRAAGSILAAADFELAAVPVATANAGSYADLAQLVGKQLLRPSRAGLLLKASDVADPTVIARNAVVTVLLKAGAMTLTVKGQALGTAAAGQPVDVLNTVTRKILHGIARADGSVEIPAATASL